MPRKRDQAPPVGEMAFQAARGETAGFAGAGFPAVMGNLPRGGPESRPCGPGETRCPAGEAALYRQLRENVPIIDAAVMRLVRLLGGFTLRIEGNEAAEKRLCEFLGMIPVGGRKGAYRPSWAATSSSC
jgi:hypothetical protein